MPRRTEKQMAAAIELVSADAEALHEFFSPVGFGFRPQQGPGALPLIMDADHTVVAWEFKGVHDHDFQGIVATGRPVLIKGVTIVDHAAANGPLFHRYVDWLDVMAQIGVSSTHRPAVDSL